MSAAILDEGSGPPLIVFHGWNGSSHNVLRWLPALVDRFRVIVPDLPGCGGVPRLDERHDADAYARYAARLLDTLGVGEAYAGGLCSGTAIALALAAHSPDRVRGLLLHTPFLDPDLIRPAVRWQLRALASPAGALFGPLRKSTALATLHRRIFANAADVEADQLAHDQADLLLADTGAARDLAADLLRSRRVDVVRGWRRPIAALLAQGDAFVDAPRTVAVLHDAAPHAAIELIPGGHGWTPAYVAAQQAALSRLAPLLLARSE